MYGDRQPLASLFLLDREHASVHLVPPHSQTITLALAGEQRQGNRPPEIGAASITAQGHG